MKIGTCGFCEKHSQYYKDFDVLEIQNTFYDFVNEGWLEKLRKEAPDNFEFTIKAIQIITHPESSPTYRKFRSKFGNNSRYGFFRKTEEIYSSMEKMLEYSRILRSKIIILQAPPNFKETKENVENLHEFFSEFSDKEIILGLELRAEWDTSTIKKFTEKFGILHVTDPFRNISISDPFRYFRLHGITGYSYRYSTIDMLKLKNMVKDVDYILFNNIYMCDNAKEFINLNK
ncbi:MAG: DUF72 domain-containing protein [Thermoplasmata archaeon]